jgi:hypothetical protein
MFLVPKFISGLSIGIILCGFTCLYFYELKKKNNKISISSKNIQCYIETRSRYFLDFWFGKFLMTLLCVIAFWAFWYHWKLNDTILAFTGWAILLYTWKTWQLKDLTAKQVWYATKPVVTLTIEENKDYDLGGVKTKKIQKKAWVDSKTIAKLKNVGEGVAMNIEIIPIKAAEVEDDIVYVESGETIALAKNDKESLTLYVHNKYDNSELAYKLIDAWTIDDTIKIEYNDLQGNKFYTLMKRKEKGGGWHFFKIGEEHRS